MNVLLKRQDRKRVEKRPRTTTRNVRPVQTTRPRPKDNPPKPVPLPKNPLPKTPPNSGNPQNNNPPTQRPPTTVPPSPVNKGEDLVEELIEEPQPAPVVISTTLAVEPVSDPTISIPVSNEIPSANFGQDAPIEPDGNTSSSSIEQSNGFRPSAGTLLTILLPIAAVVGLLILGFAYYKKRNSSDRSAGKAASRLDFALADNANNSNGETWFGHQILSTFTGSKNNASKEVEPAPVVYEPFQYSSGEENVEKPAENGYGIKAMFDTSVTTVTNIGKGLFGFISSAKSGNENSAETMAPIEYHEPPQPAVAINMPHQVLNHTIYDETFETTNYNANFAGNKGWNQSPSSQPIVEPINDTPIVRKSNQIQRKQVNHESTEIKSPQPNNDYNPFTSMVSITELQFVPPSAQVQPTNIFANTADLDSSHPLNLDQSGLYSPTSDDNGNRDSFRPTNHYSIYSVPGNQ